MNLNFNTYEELSDFCYPYDKNLASRLWTDEEKYRLLEQLAKFYREKMDEISVNLNSKYTLMVHVTMTELFWGRCWDNKQIIELNSTLICYPPMLLIETIIHELTHYQYAAHGKRFYELMEQNVNKLGLQDELYGWKERGILYPTSANKWVRMVKKKTKDEIMKFFKISYTSKKKWKPIPNGTVLDIKNNWASLTVPAYANTPRIQGILNRAEIVYYAERTFKDYIKSVSPCFNLDLDDYTIVISNWFKYNLKERRIELPVWLIGMQPDMRKRFIATMLTRMEGSDKDFRHRLSRNLVRLELDNVPAPSGFCLFQIFNPWETALFDEQGRQKIRYEGPDIEET